MGWAPLAMTRLSICHWTLTQNYWLEAEHAFLELFVGRVITEPDFE
jgi:hypothetical protein